MELHILKQGKNEPPQLAGLPQPITDLTSNMSMTMCVIEAGMASGEPSVIIVSSSKELGSFALQTSLDKFIMAVTSMIALAETHFGWKRPEGYATLMPMDKSLRKELLENIQKELEEWDDTEE